MDVRLVVVGGEHSGKVIPIRQSEFVIGRGEGSHLRAHSSAVSRKHCAIVVKQGVVAIEDFGSTNGTFVNGQRIQERRELNIGDRIQIHQWEFELQLAGSPAAKTKPKVHSVQEAAARTVAAAAAGEDGVDIHTWVEEDETTRRAAARAKKPAADEDTATGKSLTNTAAVPAPAAQTGAKTKEKTPAKPPTNSASSAVDDMLRRFFTTKR
jgi:hypothetical protein